MATIKTTFPITTATFIVFKNFFYFFKTLVLIFGVASALAASSPWDFL